MYHPSRGGSRGGTDQFTWDSVKTDKHRENYLGHSVMAPVGRWQKGKDLSWYSKERKTEDNGGPSKASNNMASIKKAEEEAMLIALGFKTAETESRTLSKEDVVEALKRNTDERDVSVTNVERIEGVGTQSGRASMMIINRTKPRDTDGVMFETASRKSSTQQTPLSETSGIHKSSKRKSSKKHKKEKKKHKKNKKQRVEPCSLSESDTSDSSKQNRKTKHSRDYHHLKDQQSSKIKLRQRHDSNSSSDELPMKHKYSEACHKKSRGDEKSEHRESDTSEDESSKQNQKTKHSRDYHHLKDQQSSKVKPRQRHGSNNSSSEGLPMKQKYAEPGHKKSRGEAKSELRETHRTRDLEFKPKKEKKRHDTSSESEDDRKTQHKKHKHSKR